jgi:hypothetical protein
MTDITLLMNFHLDGAANNRSKYSAVKIITQAVSKQKNTILYLSPHDRVPARPGLIPHGTLKRETEKSGKLRKSDNDGKKNHTCFNYIRHYRDGNEETGDIVKDESRRRRVRIFKCTPHSLSDVRKWREVGVFRIFRKLIIL